eukprot:4649668-Pyramimonas_sp.AAC.1
MDASYRPHLVVISLRAAWGCLREISGLCNDHLGACHPLMPALGPPGCTPGAVLGIHWCFHGCRRGLCAAFPGPL